MALQLKYRFAMKNFVVRSLIHIFLIHIFLRGLLR